MPNSSLLLQSQNQGKEICKRKRALCLSSGSVCPISEQLVFGSHRAGLDPAGNKDLLKKMLPKISKSFFNLQTVVFLLSTVSCPALTALALAGGLAARHQGHGPWGQWHGPGERGEKDYLISNISLFLIIYSRQ
jgi:hypothetical protein